tara:strand:- start:732 stop:2948 length:2217 start_codon:yes stop_codon:yes gene_type:complete
MIKQVVKFLLYIFFLLALLIGYLSIFGIKTTKFNNKIKNEVLGINKNIYIDLKTVKILLDIKNLAFEIKTLKPTIIFNNKKLPLTTVKTNVSIRSLITNKFSINDLNISTEDIKLKDIILLASSFKQSTELFLIKKILKDGFLVADINLNFDGNGKIKDNYQINGIIKNGKLSLFNKYNINNLDLIFKIKKDDYSLKDVKTDFNKINLFLPFLNIKKKTNSLLINGRLLNEENEINIQSLNFLLKNNFKNNDIKKISINSESDFNFNLNKRFKISNFELKSKINLINFAYKNDTLKIKKYLPNFEDSIVLKNHKIIIKYKKKKLDIKGKGKISIDNKIDNKIDNLDYELTNSNNSYNFDTTLYINKNSFLLDTLNYKKKEDLNSTLNFKGTYKKNKKIIFNTILLKDNNKNYFKINDLILNSNFKIDDINSFDLNFTNINNIKNEIHLKKNKSNYEIYGNSFDASKLINEILNNDNKESRSIFNNLNSKLTVKISKTYLNNLTFIKNLNGNIKLKNNKIFKLNLKSFFPNNKRLTLSINTNANNEKITTLFSDYPKPLIKKYKFIKGFDEGVLDFYSITKNNISNSVLNIDNFKIQELPILAKLLTLSSLQGIADLLTGEGMRFTVFEMKFSNQKDLMTIEEIYAIGPAISILMDGYIESKKLISLRGTLVPATTINRTIASIPLIGNILVGKKTGEGVFGVSFKIKGSPKNLKTTVNPIKTLTPRFITRTLEKIKKN